MKSAVIGLGVIGHVHMEVLTQLKKDVVAICDIDEAKFAEFSSCSHYTDYQKMIDEVRPDVVHICTPHHLHAEMVIYALNKGVNVLCEKPLCIHKEEIEKIIQAEKNSTAKLGVVMQNRYNPANAFVKDYLGDKKALNGYATVVWNRDAAYYAQAEWRGTKDMEGGGVLINQALHTLDLLQWFCGEPQYASATVSNLTLQNEIEVEDTASALYTGNANFSFFATNGSRANYEPEVTLHTDKQTIRIFPDYVIIDGELRRFERGIRTYGKNCYGSGHEFLFAHFYNCLQTGEPFPINGEEGAKVVKMILAAYASNGNKITI